MHFQRKQLFSNDDMTAPAAQTVVSLLESGPAANTVFTIYTCWASKTSPSSIRVLRRTHILKSLDSQILKFSRAFFAASCSASFLLGPLARASGSPATSTSTSNRFS